MRILPFVMLALMAATFYVVGLAKPVLVLTAGVTLLVVSAVTVIAATGRIKARHPILAVAAGTVLWAMMLASQI